MPRCDRCADVPEHRRGAGGRRRFNRSHSSYRTPEWSDGPRQSATHSGRRPQRCAGPREGRHLRAGRRPLRARRRLRGTVCVVAAGDQRGDGRWENDALARDYTHATDHRRSDVVALGRRSGAIPLELRARLGRHRVPRGVPDSARSRSGQLRGGRRRQRGRRVCDPHGTLGGHLVRSVDPVRIRAARLVTSGGQAVPALWLVACAHDRAASLLGAAPAVGTARARHPAALASDAPARCDALWCGSRAGLNSRGDNRATRPTAIRRRRGDHASDMGRRFHQRTRQAWRSRS